MPKMAARDMSDITKTKAQNQPAQGDIFPVISRREQRELFRADLPSTPYCMARRDGRPAGRMYVQPLYIAARFPYIQINPPWLTAALVFDIDRPGGASAWYLNDMPEPVAAVINKSNQHAHLIFVLNAPVLTGTNARRKPQVLMAAIYGAMCARMEADPAYSGLIAKNPLAGRTWRVLWSQRPARYDLNFLTEFLTEQEVKRHWPRKANRKRLAGLGRNVDTFNAVFKWSQRAIREHWSGDFGAWFDAVECRVESVNGDYTNPMAYSECKSIAKSISKWTWARFSPEGFSASQAARGKRGGDARAAVLREQNEQRDGDIIAARLDGVPADELAARYNLTARRVNQIVADAGLR